MTKDFKGQYLMTCIERRSVTLPFHGHNLHSRTIEENYELLFCSWVKSCTGKPYMSNFSLFFFCHICRTTFVNIQKFRYHGNVTKRLLFTVGKKIKIKTYKLNRSIWFYASTMSRIACSMSNITAALVKKKLHMIPNTIPNWRQRLVTLMKVSILQVTRPNSQLNFDESNA